VALSTQAMASQAQRCTQSQPRNWLPLYVLIPLDLLVVYLMQIECWLIIFSQPHILPWL
jgi:hypothetical protein